MTPLISAPQSAPLLPVIVLPREARARFTVPGGKVVVVVELAIISYIRFRYMDTPFLQAAFQVVVGGVLVFLAGILIGSS